MDNNLDYMIMGYVAGILILAITVASIWWRYQSLQKDEHALQELENEVVQQETHDGIKVS
jgi:hypothetical protein